MAKQGIDIKTVAINAAVTALVVAVVNNVFNKSKGLGLPGKFLANLPLERQAQFADIATISNIKNPGFFKEQLRQVDIEDPEFYKNVKKEAVGNCAFVVLNTTDSQLRATCLHILENYKKYA